MAERYTLGVDIGTSSSKGVLVDRAGVIIAEASVAHTVDMPRAGFFEQDADAVWWQDFRDVTEALLTRSRIAPEQVAAVGVSAIAPCVLPVDAAGVPLRPGILYGIDTRATAEIDELAERYGAADERVRALSSQSVAPKLLWLQRHEPEVWAKTHTVLGAEGYLVRKLTGESVLDVYDASAAYAPLIDGRGTRWSADYPELCPPSRLPTLAWGCEVVGAVTPDAAAQTGLAASTPVVAGTADAAAEALSAGMRQDGDLMVMYGTSTFFILRTALAATSTRFWPSHFHEPGTYAVAGGMATSGGLVAWFRELLGRRVGDGAELGYDDVTALARESVPGAHGLLALPYFAGERTPFFDPLARGAFLGLTLRHTREDLCRALLEAIAYGIRDNIEALRAEGFPVRQVLAVGGGTQNDLLVQIVSDVCDIEQRIPVQTVGASLGDALRAAVGVGIFDSLTAAVSTVEHQATVRPDESLKPRYDELFALYRASYRQTADIVHRLAGLE
ncbi:FGGY family carbohydrate kinase [Pseudonocardia sp.]|jgi:xylulokinase|uniref:FGGY-family carbohydrate kinase n=1 Tax=Pseudonocardia sp. TaxID=60912 RepID=UPI0031FBB056